MAVWDPRSNELFLNALEIDSPAERQAYLDKGCGEDAPLRQAVERLLQAHEAAGGFLEPKSDQTGRANDLTVESFREGAGTTIGNYKLLQLIGEGGFGSVFMAEQERPVRRRVALKIIKLGMDSKQVIARFEAERQALAMMDHTHIARVFDAGTTDTGRPYFVMELVRGIPITDYCDRQNLSTRERLELFIPVCNAVQHAHQKGIIHRDLKPSNVMVTLADGKPIPKIIDFGIAKATNARLTEQTYFTEYHQFIGTPQYMSPEQAEMTGIDIDTRSDIYSLGVLLYELLTGTTPLDAIVLRSQAYDQMRRMIREVEPPVPSTRFSGLGDSATAIAQHRKTEPRRLEQLLRGELDWIVMRALEKDRTRRYDTPGSLASDIQRHLDNEPVLARPPSAIYAIRKFVSKHRVIVLAGTAVLTALLVGLTLATFGFIRARADRRVADRERATAQAQRIIAENQKQLAIDNAKRADANAAKAEQNARNAELRLAEGRIAQGDALTLAKRLADAHAIYRDAYDRFVNLRADPFKAELALSCFYADSPPALLTLRGHTKGVTYVALGADGRTVVSGSRDGTLRLWDLRTGRQLRALASQGASANSRVQSANGRTLLSVNVDNTLSVWDLATGSEIHTFKENKSQIYSVALSADGRTAVTGGYDRLVRLWDLETGREIRTMSGQSNLVVCIAMSPDGHTALSGSYSGELIHWDLETGHAIHTLHGHFADVLSVAFSPDGQTALSGGYDTTLKLWNLQTGSVIRTMTGHTSGVTSVAMSVDGRTALSGGGDQTVKLWDVPTGREICTFQGHTGGISTVALDPDARTAFSASADSTIKIWDLPANDEVRNSQGKICTVGSIALSADGHTAISGNLDGTVSLWDVATAHELKTFTGHKRPVTSVVLSADGRTALSGSRDKTLKLWDIETGREKLTLQGHTSDVYSVALSADGRLALSGSDDKTVKLWDLETGREVYTLRGHTYIVSGVAFSPDNRTALSASYDAKLKLWDLQSGRETRTIQGGNMGSILGMALSADGRTAFTGSDDRTIRVWDLQSGQEIRTLDGHTTRVNSIALSVDGKIAFSAATDLKLWDLQTGREIRTLKGQTNPVSQISCVAIAANGRIAAAGDFVQSLKFWDFARGSGYLPFEATVPKAQASLQLNPDDPAALAVFGNWYALRGRDDWAVELLEKAGAGGAPADHLTLARCYWNLNRNTDARREFQIAREQSKESAERTYLGLCVQCIDSKLERKRK